jgi:Chaperone of endosialidase
LDVAKTPLNAISRSNKELRVSLKWGELFVSLIGMLLVPRGTGLQLMQFNNPPSTKNMTTPDLKKSIDRPPLRLGLLLIPLVVACFALSWTAQAVTPAPDGGYSNENTAEGTNALFSVTSGDHNTATGFESLFSNTTGVANTATGHNTLGSNSTGNHNTATGGGVLASNTTASENTGTGHHALSANTTGVNNTATGSLALTTNSTGNNNTANGFEALALNTTASYGVANGFAALVHNTTGPFNSANGAQALFNNSTGGSNTAEGTNALFRNTTASNNTAAGFEALFNNTGANNTALGSLAGVNLTTGSNNIDIANQGAAGQANTIRIGTVGTQTATFIAGISGATVAGGVGVIVDTSGHLGTVMSSARLKEAIKPMDKSSESILALKPVTFRYRHELDPNGIPQFGLVAEQVEKVNPDLVVRGEDGKVMTVRYEAVNAMLLNEFLKEHRKVESLEGIVTQQQKQIEALTAGLQKVTARVEAANAVPRVVSDN